MRTRTQRSVELRDRLAQIDLDISQAAQTRVRADSLALAERLGGPVRVDTLWRGPVRVVVRSDQRASAEPLLDAAFQWLATPLSAAEPLPLTMTVEFADSPSGLGVTDPVRAWVRPDLSQVRASEQVQQAMRTILRAGLPWALQEWLGHESLQDPWNREWRSFVLRELVTTKAQSVADCRAGIVSRCWDALETESQGDRSIGEIWYSRAERLESARAWQERGQLRRILAPDAGSWEACVSGQDDPCDAALRRLRVWPHPPLSQSVRAHLLSFALDRGGEGAYRRLVESDGTLSDRLATAAGAPAEELMRDWLTAVSEGHRPVTAGMAGGLPGLGVFVLLTVLVAARSSRWRFA